MPNIFVDGFGMLMLINSRKNPYRVDLLHSVDHITCHRFRMNFSELFRFNTEIDISIDSAAYKLVYRVRSFAVSIDASCFNLFTNYAFTYSIICSIVLLLLNHNNDSLDWCNVFCKKWTGAWKRRKQKRNLLTLSTHYEHLHEYIEHRTSNRTANIHTRSQSRCNSICEATPMRVLWALCVCVCMTITIDNKIGKRWKWKPKNIYRVYSAVSLRHVSPVPTPPHKYTRCTQHIDHHTLKSHVLVVTKCSNVMFHRVEGSRQKQLHQFLAESCRHRVKLFAIFFNLHIPQRV